MAKKSRNVENTLPQCIMRTHSVFIKPMYCNRQKHQITCHRRTIDSPIRIHRFDSHTNTGSTRLRSRRRLRRFKFITLSKVFTFPVFDSTNHPKIRQICRPSLRQVLFHSSTYLKYTKLQIRITHTDQIEMAINCTVSTDEYLVLPP